MIDFSKEINQGGIIFQQSSSFNNDSDFGFASYNYVSGTHDQVAVDLATTTEINVNFPALLPYYSEHRIVRPLSSSLFGISMYKLYTTLFIYTILIDPISMLYYV